MKKIFPVVLVLLLLFGAASSLASDVSKEIDLTYCLYFNDASDYLDLKEEFPKVFEEKTGYKLNMNILAREEYLTKLNLLALSGDLKGIVRTFGISDLISWRRDDMIVPINGILENPNFTDNISSRVIDYFTFDGDLWAIPMGADGMGSMFGRTYRQDWLDKLGLEVPHTIDEFYEVMKAFATQDPTGTGAATYGFTSRNNWTMQDIYAAFDARLDNTGDTSIGYDPMLGYWADSMVKPEMVEALEFLRKCYAEGLLDPEVFTNSGAAMRERMYASQAGSIYYWSTFGLPSTLPNYAASAPDAKLAFTYGLTGKRTEKVNFVSGSIGLPLVMAAGTPNADEMANNFVDAFIGSEIGHEMARFGIEGVTYRKAEDGTIIRLWDETAENWFPYPGLVDMYGPKYDLVNMPFATDGTPEQIATSLTEQQSLLALHEAAKNDPMMFIEEEGGIAVSEAWERLKGDINMAYLECISSAVMGTVPVQEAIDNYISVMRAIGAATAIDEINAYNGFDAPAFVY